MYYIKINEVELAEIGFALLSSWANATSPKRKASIEELMHKLGKVAYSHIVTAHPLEDEEAKEE